MSTKEWPWRVYDIDMISWIDVMATSSKDASAQGKERLKRKIVYPHREGCECETIPSPCMKGILEARFKGTGLGRLCGL